MSNLISKLQIRDNMKGRVINCPSNVKLDDTWSALRFRQKKYVTQLMTVRLDLIMEVRD